MGWLDPVSQGLGVVSDVTNIGSGLINLFTAKKRREEQWKREDNAVQRRALDMEKAGLSKTLAAGGAAQSSDPIRPAAFNTNVGALEDARTAKAQRGLQRAQTETGQAQAALIRGQAGLLQAQKENTEADTAVKLANAPKIVADRVYTEGAQTDKTKAETENLEMQKRHIAEQTANLIEQRTGIQVDNQMKQLMYDTTRQDIIFFGLVNQPYTRDIFSGGIPSIVAQNAAGFMGALKNVVDEAIPAVTRAFQAIPWGSYIQSGKNAYQAASTYIKDLSKKGIDLGAAGVQAINELFEGAMK